MHTLFALITLAFAAAVFVWEGLCCLRTGDFRAELSRRFSCEHALFGDFCWNQRQKLAGPLYFAALFVLLFGRIFLHASQLYTVTPPWVYGSMYLLYPLMYIPLLLKFFFCTRYDLRQLLVVLAFYIFTTAAILPSYEQDIFSLFGFIAAFKDINWRKALACFAAFTTAMAAVLIVLSLSGVLLIWHPQYTTRMELGFENPNHLSRILLSIVTAYLLLLPAQKRRAAALWMLLPTLLFVKKFPGSRSVFLALAVLILLCLLFPLVCRVLQNRAIRSLLSAVPLFLLAASAVAAWCYDPSNAVWEKIARFSNGRLQYWSYVTTLTSPRLLAQELPKSPVPGMEDPVIDNSYFYLLYRNGILLTIVLVMLSCFLIYRLLKARRYWFVCVLFCWITHSPFESFFFCIFSNFMLLLLAPLLFGQPFPEDGTPSKAT